jgi:hypothetical protein
MNQSSTVSDSGQHKTNECQGQGVARHQSHCAPPTAIQIRARLLFLAGEEHAAVASRELEKMVCATSSNRRCKGTGRARSLAKKENKPHGMCLVPSTAGAGARACQPRRLLAKDCSLAVTMQR